MPLELHALRIAFPGWARLLDCAPLSLSADSTYALLCANGARKPTLFNNLTGFIRSDSGEIIFGGAHITRIAADKINRKDIGRTFVYAFYLRK